MIYHHCTPLGTLLFETENNDFTKIWFPKKNQVDPNTFPSLPNKYAAELKQYFAGKAVAFNWPIKLKGTLFQNRVWQEIIKIPYGETRTYKEIGENLATKGYQAVGRSVGANPLTIIIPCHRVVGSADLGGYHYGLMIKRFLLEIENALPPLHLA